MAGASLIEAEIVTADGEVRIANACTNPDLFWALKGGGGGFGVVTRVTLRTHALPEFFGGVFATIKATSDDAYRRLIGKIIEFYREALFNPHWGEQIGFRPGGVVSIAMVFQGLDQQQAEEVWRPFFDWVAASPQDFAIVSRAADRRGAGRSVSGTPRCCRRFPASSSATIVRARRRTISSGRATSARRASSGTPISPPGCRRRSSNRTSAELADALVCRAQHCGVDAALQQGACGRRRGCDRGGEGDGDQPGGDRRLRARNQPAPTSSPPIPAFPDTSRTRAARRELGRRDRGDG